MEETNPCFGCTKCCNHVALEIDTPEDKEDFDQIRWFLVHRDVFVFIDHDDSWNLQFNSPCEKLSENGSCTIYDKRPTICREYDSENCERYGEGNSYKVLWKNLEEFEEWMKKNKSEFL